MHSFKIAVIVGSLRRDSFNRKLAGALVKLAPEEFSFSEVSIGDLPLYNQDDDAKQADPVVRLKSAITAADGLLFVTAEYNRSIPGVLKNAIDHGSRPHGHNAWQGKPAAIIGVSPGATGTAMAQQHLRNVLVAVGVSTMVQPEVFPQAKEGLFDEAGNIGPASQKFLQGWMQKFAGWVEQQAR
jgi:chromate reductase